VEAAEEGPASTYCWAASTSMGLTGLFLDSRLRMDGRRPKGVEKAVMAEYEGDMRWGR
jgi:hypothetical protein